MDKRIVHLTGRQYNILVEALRRYLKFGKPEGKSLGTAWTGLGYRTEYQPMVDAGFMAWVKGIPAHRAMGWLVLTKKGEAIVQRWIDSGFIVLFFNGTWETVHNEDGESPPARFEFDVPEYWKPYW